MKFLKKVFRHSSNELANQKNTSTNHQDIQLHRVALKEIAERNELTPSTRVKELSQALHDTHWEIRVEAVKLIGNLGCPESIEPLTAALKDETVNVRSFSAEALAKLGSMGYTEVVEPLVIALADQSHYVSSPAALSLGKLGDIRAFRPLVDICSGKEGVASWHGPNAVIILKSLLEQSAEKLAEEDLIQASLLDSYDAIHDDTGGAWIDGKTISQMASRELQRRGYLSKKA